MPKKKAKTEKDRETINTGPGTTIKRYEKSEVQNFYSPLSSFCILVVSCYRLQCQVTTGHMALENLMDCQSI